MISATIHCVELNEMELSQVIGGAEVVHMGSMKKYSKEHKTTEDTNTGVTVAPRVVLPTHIHPVDTKAPFQSHYNQ